MLPNSVLSRLVSFGSATILAIREMIVKATNGGDVRSERIRDYSIDIITVLFISVGLVIGIMVIWVEAFFIIVWLLLFLLGGVL